MRRHRTKDILGPTKVVAQTVNLANTWDIKEHQYDEDYEDYPKDALDEAQHDALPLLSPNSSTA
jgi:hypothetical protein